MCGIASIFAYASDAADVDRDELVRISERMILRGPDGSGEWYSADGRVGLAHRRLAIIDLTEAGAQPMGNANGGVTITYNGEIYNYHELRSRLESRGHIFRSTSDTEVLLKLYEEKGSEMLDDLRGMFALAIWDSRNRSLFLARDPFGIKPLYYSDNGATIRVASQVKALLSGGVVDTSPEPAGHVGFLLWGSVPEPYTLYKSIKSLPAGCSLSVDYRGNKTLKQFCSIPRELAQSAELSVQLTSDQAQQKLRDTLLDTVRHHLIADVPVGTFLSSGLDSATLTALAAEVSQNTQHTVTLGFREFSGSRNDEVPLAELVARLYGTRHSTVYVEKYDFIDEMRLLLDAMDQPTIDGVNSYFVCKAAVKAGLKVAISGLGGDELFGGYPGFRQIPLLVKNIGPFGSVPGFGKGFRLLTVPLIKHLTSPKYAGLLEYGGSYGGAYLLRRSLYMPWELPSLLDGEMVREGWGELQTMLRLNDTTHSVPGGYLKVAALDMCWYMRNMLLRDSDWASMAHSLEVRVPLVDLHLLRKVVPLLSSGTPVGKREMALTPSTPLPDSVISRRKTGFIVPVRDWMAGTESHSCERGLRGWARNVYAAYAL
jgi:asparagine synthase (glutamine-hydrolysing)